MRVDFLYAHVSPRKRALGRCRRGDRTGSGSVQLMPQVVYPTVIVAAKTRPEMMWREAFSQLGNTSIESRFADYRTYFYKGEEIDQQVHLGFDLAVTAAVPIGAAHRGRVVLAEYLGIYGNCVILDHGMGLQSLYGHLSSIGTSA